MHKPARNRELAEFCPVERNEDRTTSSIRRNPAIEFDGVERERARLVGEADNIVDAKLHTTLGGNLHALDDKLVRIPAVNHLAPECFVPVLDAESHAVHADLGKPFDAARDDRLRPRLAPEGNLDVGIHLAERLEFLVRPREKRVGPEEEILRSPHVAAIDELAADFLHRFLAEEFLPHHFHIQRIL